MWLISIGRNVFIWPLCTFTKNKCCLVALNRLATFHKWLWSLPNNFFFLYFCYYSSICLEPMVPFPCSGNQERIMTTWGLKYNIVNFFIPLILFKFSVFFCSLSNKFWRISIQTLLLSDSLYIIQELLTTWMAIGQSPSPCPMSYVLCVHRGHRTYSSFI